MDLITVVGWCAAFTGATMGIPQAWHIWRTRDIEGVSLWTWQTMLAINIAWGSHGVRIGAPNLIAVNVIGATVTVTILVLMSRSLGLTLMRAALPGVLIGAVMVSIDEVFGGVAFGLVAIIPGTWGLLAQSRELVRAPRIDGVSLPFLIVMLVNLVLWLSWGILADDAAAQIANGVALVVGVFNLAWYVGRRARTRVTVPTG